MRSSVYESISALIIVVHLSWYSVADCWKLFLINDFLQ